MELIIYAISPEAIGNEVVMQYPSEATKDITLQYLEEVKKKSGGFL